MGVIRCPRCRKAYEFIGLPPRCCPECLDIEKTEFDTVRSHIRSHPGATIQVISDSTGIPTKKILQYMKDDWFVSIKKDESAYVRCSVCGKSIMSGDLCVQCRQKSTGFMHNIVR